MEPDEKPTDDVTINDVINMVNIIDICCERGSFLGHEMEGVGKMRNRLYEFCISQDVPIEVFNKHKIQESEVDNETE